MDPRDGEVLALGSYPSFDANLFAKPIDQETYERAQQRGERRAAVQPRDLRRLSDRLDVQADHRVRGGRRRDHHAEHAAQRPRRVRVRRPRVQERRRRRVRRAGAAARAPGLLRRVLLPARRGANERGPVIQEWARKLSFGKPTGIDLRASTAAWCPTASGATASSTKYLKCAEEGEGRRPDRTEALYACGGIERGWSGGDNVNLAVGQGDLQATPLQLATAYAAIANGGRVVTPHLGQQVEDGAGRQLEEIRKPAKRRVDFDPGDARGDPRRPARRRRRRRRHLGRRVRRLPVHGLRQDRHRRARARTPTSRGTRPTSTTRSSRSSSWSRSRRAASAPRRPRPPRA